MAELTEFRKPSTYYYVYARGERDPASIGGCFYQQFNNIYKEEVWL